MFVCRNGNGRVVRLGDGDEPADNLPILSCCGVQGDPLGPLGFALVLHSVIEKITHSFPLMHAFIKAINARHTDCQFFLLVLSPYMIWIAPTRARATGHAYAHA